MNAFKSFAPVAPLLVMSLVGCSGIAATDQPGVVSHVENAGPNDELTLAPGQTKTLSILCAPKSERGCRYQFTASLANEDEVRKSLTAPPNAEAAFNSFKTVMVGDFSGFSSQNLLFGYTTIDGTTAWQSVSDTLLSAGEHALTFALADDLPSTFPGLRFTITNTSEEASAPRWNNHVLVLNADGSPHANDDAVLHWVSGFVDTAQACANDAECMSTSATCVNRICAEPDVPLKSDDNGAFDLSTVSGNWEITVGGMTFGFETRGFQGEVAPLQL